MWVKIIEKFTLTGQYTPKLFFDAYRTSMSMELKNYSILVYNMFRTAQITFPEEQKMELKMQSSVLAKRRRTSCIVYSRRYSASVVPSALIVEPEYVEASESKVRKQQGICRTVSCSRDVSSLLRAAGGGRSNSGGRSRFCRGDFKGREKGRRSCGKHPGRRKKPRKTGRKKREGRKGQEAVSEKETAVTAILSAASSAPTVRMCSTAEILKMRPFPWKASRRRWERSASAVRS